MLKFRSGVIRWVKHRFVVCAAGVGAAAAGLRQGHADQILSKNLGVSTPER